jgi:superfamily II DNA or RNA helicase
VTNPFQERLPAVIDNGLIRTPQQEAYAALSDFVESEADDREIGIVLPVGCGKSGCIALTPFAFAAKRALVIAPGVPIANQLSADFDPSNPQMFYQKCNVLVGPPFPEPVQIRGDTVNRGDLDESQVVIANIQQLQGNENRWLKSLPSDYFDLLVFDEGHHAVAATWTTLKAKFPDATVVNFSATPLRADGQIMAGRIIYSYPVYRAIQEGYVKRLKAVVLNPRTLRYVRREDGKEIEVSLDEVRILGEQNADFRRSIVTSTETLNTIVDASIRELQKRRAAAQDNRLKIIASALNYEHCHQIVAAYQSRGLQADYVHSREDQAANQRVMQRLDAHDLDVIVQVRKLGEGFDHPYLTVAAVFSIFSNLSPFIQFVGRIMRVIKQSAPEDPLNQGVVVFHAGANVASRWDDFRHYSEADQDYFDQLLPLEPQDPAQTEEDEIEIEPTPRISLDQMDVRSQSDVRLEEIPLIDDDTEAIKMLQALKDRGYTTDQLLATYEQLDPVPTTKVRERQARRRQLDRRIMRSAAQMLNERGINPEGKELDKQYRRRTNLVVLKSEIDRQVNAFVGQTAKARNEFTREEFDQVDNGYEDLVSKAVEVVFGPS